MLGGCNGGREWGRETGQMNGGHVFCKRGCVR